MATVAVLAALLMPMPAATTNTTREGCQTVACERRVRKKRAVHRRYPYCNTWRCVRRADRRALRRRLARWRRAIAPYRGWLASTRACESGGNYSTNTGNGFYGAYQFTLSSWRAAGGYGYPHLASPLEQDYRAVVLLHIQGRGAWPVCG